MPNASPDLRAKMDTLFGDEIDSSGPISFLEKAGYRLSQDWTWGKSGVTELWQMQADEFACLQFLVDEWDFGGLEEGMIDAVLNAEARVSTNPQKTEMQEISENKEKAAVRVKPLKWTPWTGSASYAYSEIGEYTVDFDYDEAMAETPYVAWAGDDNLGHFRTLEDAQGANNEEHERRIRSEIEVTE